MSATLTSDRSYARRCAQAVNALHSIPYFTADLADRLSPFGVTDRSSVYMAGRAAPLGAVDAPVVTAVFNTFAPDFVAERVPAIWRQVSPEEAVAAREAAAGTALERLLSTGVIRSAAMAEAAELAGRAAAECSLPGRPLYAANAALDRPDEPHIALWHASTMLREHRGDGHVAILGHAELTGVEALVIDCASELGMPKEIVRPMRGWTEADWAAAQERLRERGLVSREGVLTTRGTALRDEIEHETGRLDRRPYELLGGAEVGKLAEFTHGLVLMAAASQAFPPPLRSFFAPDTSQWSRL
ncbi:SCO6745 family protein [Streptomyces sp. B21-083]|uniref:SCO6745 family protein n=1 Tax=Streptomyces sp. B21-083 TaxID=3039410 RepID=UPI002FF296E2